MRRLLLKRGPEERGGNQQDKADQQSGALFAVQTGKDEQVDKVECNGGNHVYQHAGNRDRLMTITPCAISVTITATDGQRQQPRAHAVTFTTGLFQV